jgi:hypothetical protein
LVILLLLESELYLAHKGWSRYSVGDRNRHGCSSETKKNLTSILRAAAVPMIEEHSTHTVRHYLLGSSGQQLFPYSEVTRRVPHTGAKYVLIDRTFWIAFAFTLRILAMNTGPLMVIQFCITHGGCSR